MYVKRARRPGYFDSYFGSYFGYFGGHVLGDTFVFQNVEACE